MDVVGPRCGVSWCQLVYCIIGCGVVFSGVLSGVGGVQ